MASSSKISAMNMNIFRPWQLTIENTKILPITNEKLDINCSVEDFTTSREIEDSTNAISEPLVSSSTQCHEIPDVKESTPKKGRKRSPSSLEEKSSKRQKTVENVKNISKSKSVPSTSGPKLPSMVSPVFDSMLLPHASPFGPFIPMLEPQMLIPAAEVERVCARRPRPKRFTCNECGAAFSNRGQLSGHCRIHTGERPFRCTQPGCGKKFTRNEELTRHRRIHSGLRPFACTLCPKRFGRKDHLKKHLRTHTRHILPHIPPLTQFDHLHHLQQMQHWQQIHQLHQMHQLQMQLPIPPFISPNKTL